MFRMKKWIAAGLVAMMLCMVGAYSAYRSYKQNRPNPIWVPLPINPELPVAERDETIKQLLTKLQDPAILEKVSADLNLTQKMELPTDQEVAAELSKRLFVRAGDMDTPMGKVPSIHIGMNGKVKESKLAGEICVRLMDDVWALLGIEPPARK